MASRASSRHTLPLILLFIFHFCLSLTTDPKNFKISLKRSRRFDWVYTETKEIILPETTCTPISEPPPGITAGTVALSVISGLLSSIILYSCYRLRKFLLAYVNYWIHRLSSSRDWQFSLTLEVRVDGEHVPELSVSEAHASGITSSFEMVSHTSGHPAIAVEPSSSTDVGHIETISQDGALMGSTQLGVFVV